MITISLLNMKGGVGKTTLAVNLAWQLARARHKRVLVVDLDPQFNASQYLMSYEVYDKHRRGRGTVADVLCDAGRPRMQLGSTKSSSRKPAQHVYTVEKDSAGGELSLLPSELDLARAVKNPQGVEFRLAKYLDQLSPSYDYTFIDCAPTDTVLTATALMASDYVLVPVRPDRYSILGYGLMKRVIQEFKDTYPDPKKTRDLGVVFTMTTGQPDDIEKSCKTAIQKEAPYVFSAELSESKTFLRSVHEQSPAVDTRYARQLTKDRLLDLLDELEERIDSGQENAP